MAYRGIAVLLRLVGLALALAPRGLDGIQFRLEPGHRAFERERKETLAGIGNRRQPPAARHFLLHLHADSIPRRRLPAADGGPRSCTVCVVRDLVSASDRRPDPSS